MISLTSLVALVFAGNFFWQNKDKDDYFEPELFMHEDAIKKIQDDIHHLYYNSGIILEREQTNYYLFIAKVNEIKNRVTIPLVGCEKIFYQTEEMIENAKIAHENISTASVDYDISDTARNTFGHLALDLYENQLPEAHKQIAFKKKEVKVAKKKFEKSHANKKLLYELHQRQLELAEAILKCATIRLQHSYAVVEMNQGDCSGENDVYIANNRATIDFAEAILLTALAAKNLRADQCSCWKSFDESKLYSYEEFLQSYCRKCSQINVAVKQAETLVSVAKIVLRKTLLEPTGSGLGSSGCGNAVYASEQREQTKKDLTHCMFQKNCSVVLYGNEYYIIVQNVPENLTTDYSIEQNGIEHLTNLDKIASLVGKPLTIEFQKQKLTPYRQEFATIERFFSFF